MSGDLQYRVNRSWANVTQPNISHFRYFWEYLNFINSHPNFSIIAYGTGALQQGTSTPTAWLSWDDPPPMASNAWFVFRADNASIGLNGLGNYRWECKIQVADETEFDDPSGNDYGKESDANGIICSRLSAKGGWNGGSLDFAPSGGEDSGDNNALFKGKAIDFYSHIVGDDDTMFWLGRPGIPDFHRQRGGYLGMTVRRNSSILNPCISMVGAISTAAEATYGEDSHICKDTGTSHQFSFGSSSNSRWPTYHLSRDNITAIKGGGKIRLNTWNKEIVQNMGTFKATSEELILSMRISEYSTPDDHNVLGQLRLIGSCGIIIGEGVVFGTNSDWMQIGHAPGTYGGIAMRWPTGVAASF